MKIWSFGFSYGKKDWPEGVDVYDAQDLPDPHSQVTLRHLNGLHPEVQKFMLNVDGIDDWLDEIVNNPPKVGVAIGCYGGVHRSVSLAEELGRRMKVKPEHLDLAKRAPWKNIPEWEVEKKAAAKKAYLESQGLRTEVDTQWKATATVRKKAAKKPTPEEIEEARNTPPLGHRKDEYCPWCGQRSPGKKLHLACKLEQKRHKEEDPLRGKRAKAKTAKEKK